MQKVFIDRTGQVFGRLLILECTQRCNRSKGVSATKYRCLCNCGKEKTIASSSLVSGLTTSCGCYSREVSKDVNTTHGQSNSPTHNSWRAMKERCYNKNNKRYSSYGGKGIVVCPEWLNSFEVFLEEVGERPEGMTLDRINPKLDYYLENCRWADASTQAYNKNKESDGSSKRVGVSYHKRIGKWQARIRVDGKEVHLGYFYEEDKAIKARVEAELEYRGEELK